MPYQRLRQYLDAPPVRSVPYDVLMQQCEKGRPSDDRPSAEEVLEFFPDRVNQTRAAVMALSLFIDWLNRLPGSRPEFLEPEDVPAGEAYEADYPPESIFRDLRFSPRRSQRHPGDQTVYLTLPASYHRRTDVVTEYLDLVLNEALDRLRGRREGSRPEIPTMLVGPEEFGDVHPSAPWNTGLPLSMRVPMSEDLAVLGIDSLIYATELLSYNAPLEVLKWNRMAVEAFAWSWQFINAPYGGSRGQQDVTRLDWETIVNQLSDRGIVNFPDTHYASDELEDPDRMGQLMSVWKGPGWYDIYAGNTPEIPESKFISQYLPVYLALEELRKNQFYYNQFYQRWFELVGCRWPVESL